MGLYSKSASAIKKASLRGTSLVNKLLTFASKTEVKFELVSVNDLTKEISRFPLETFPSAIDRHPGKKTEAFGRRASFRNISWPSLQLATQSSDR